MFPILCRRRRNSSSTDNRTSSSMGRQSISGQPIPTTVLELSSVLSPSQVPYLLLQSDTRLFNRSYRDLLRSTYHTYGPVLLICLIRPSIIELLAALHTETILTTLIFCHHRRRTLPRVIWRPAVLLTTVPASSHSTFLCVGASAA